MCSVSAALSRGVQRPLPRRRRLLQGVTSLMYAAQQGDVDRVRHLIRSQPQHLLDQDRTGKTALHYCCTSDSNHAAQVADFITMAAPDLIESRDEDGFTPLHLAVIAGNTQLVNFLLANGADVNAVDNEKHSVVHWATVCGETTSLKAVLSAGASVSTPDIHGGYPLHYAAQMCGGDKDSHLGLQVLHTLLSQKDITVSIEDGDKRQPLLWAASAGSAKAILALVRAGAVVESSDRDGLTALHCAASRGHTDCLDTLLTLCGASPDVIDSNGCTALHYAVTLGHADATALLLAHGADPNRQDRKGRSPAHCGCAKGQFETVKLIGARGANLWMRNARGDFPVHEAAASGRRELVAWLLSMRPSQVNARNNDGRTPLHMAALNDNVDMCKILLDSGATVNPILRTTRNIFMTPLDCALQRGFRSTAKYLQLHGGVPATRLSGLPSDAQVSSSLSVQIRDDVTFWGDSSSDSDEDSVQTVKKLQKRRSSYRKRKKKLMTESESDAAKVHSGLGKTTVNTATNTSASALEESPRKASSRVDFTNEIIINGKTEINIHQTREISLEDQSPRKVEIDSCEKITIPASSTSGAKLIKEKSVGDLPELSKGTSVTSDDTMDTVIDTYKQKSESLKAEMKHGSRERVLELPEISNTSAEIDEPTEMIVEASVHAEPKMSEDSGKKGILKTPSQGKEEPTGAEATVDSDDKILVEEEKQVDIEDGAVVSKETADQIEKEPVAVVTSDETRKAEAVKDNDVEQVQPSEQQKYEQSPDDEMQVDNKQTPVSKVIGKPRKTKDDKQKSKDKKSPRSDQPAIVRVLQPNESLSADELYSSGSEVLSDSIEQQEHKSFKVLSEQEAKEIQKQTKKTVYSDKKPRSKSDDTKFKKQKKTSSKIPTPVLQSSLSKSEKQLDRSGKVADQRVPSLPNIHETSRDRIKERPDSNQSAPILPSVYSDNERGSGSDLEDQLNPTKKKKVKKRPKTRRRESKSAGSDYESSNLIDSGFEPSPRSSRVPKCRNISDRGVVMTSVTRSIQSNIRRYHLERKIFQHLLELKRNQIRAGQHNESVLVKRAIDQYNQSCASTVGAGRYIPDDLSFKSFERFLYESLRKLQKIDMAHLKGLPESCDNANPLLCTRSTHRCMHATHAYTGVPCAAYLPKMDHHSIPKIGFDSTSCKPGTTSFLPRINPKKAVTLELSHGTDKQVISLPTDKLDQNKRYYVTFTVKGQEGMSSEENGEPKEVVQSKSE